ncbi:MAG TPA: hypothetical protein VN715_12670 [Roseiarcus sp.]|nr:hypothetical protein [Roseiarcus sp.]
MRMTYLAATLGVISFAGVATQADAASGLGQLYPRSCASGYRPDAGGNCQPDSGQVNRFCAPGLVYQPYPDGWYCALAPREAY